MTSAAMEDARTVAGSGKTSRECIGESSAGLRTATFPAAWSSGMPIATKVRTNAIAIAEDRMREDVVWSVVMAGKGSLMA